MKPLMDWLDARTGIRRLTHEALMENIPGGARWRYVWGSALTFCLFVQFVTGAILWTAYSPGAQSAWESVYYIQHEMAGGWFLRGLHHYTAQLMVVLLVLHLMQVVIDGAYKAPREVNFWFGLGLLVLTLGLALTGYLLPWDQKGYWATKVATNIAAITPVFGSEIERLIVGGSDYGHLTLTRFFALHAGILPAFIVLLVVGHIALFRRHGITSKKPHRKPDAAFWPDQVLMDAVASMAVLATVVFLTVYFHGAELAAPADPSESYAAARPEWYFLFLFQFLKYFRGGTEVWGAIVLPSVALGILAVMPFLGRWQLGHRFNLAFLGCMLFGAGLLTWQALEEDRNRPEHQAAVARARSGSRSSKAPAAISASSRSAASENTEAKERPSAWRASARASSACAKPAINADSRAARSSSLASAVSSLCRTPRIQSKPSQRGFSILPSATKFSPAEISRSTKAKSIFTEAAAEASRAKLKFACNDPRLNFAAAAARACGSSASKPCGVLSFKSSPRPLTLLSSQIQRWPWCSPSTRAKPVIPEMVIAAQYSGIT